MIVDGKLWGALILSSETPEPLPPDTEFRLAGFSELVATAISTTAARQALEELAAEQAALRRVATLAAEGAESRTVVASVCEEIAQLLGASNAALARFTPDGMFKAVSAWSLRVQPIPEGERVPLDGHSVSARIYRTGQPARIDSFEGVPGTLAQRMRELGIRSTVRAPVIVDGAIWGALILASDTADPFTPDAEQRAGRFAELVGTAISNSANRAELLASRARIVAAGDEAAPNRAQLARRNAAAPHRAGPRSPARQGHDPRQPARSARGARTGRARSRGCPRGCPGGVTRPPPSPAIPRRPRPHTQGPRTAISHPGPPVRRSRQATPAPIETALYYVVAEALTNAIRHSEANEVSITIGGKHDPREPRPARDDFRRRHRRNRRATGQDSSAQSTGSKPSAATSHSRASPVRAQ